VQVLGDLSTGSIENIRHLKGRPGSTTRSSLNDTAIVAELVDDADVVYTPGRGGWGSADRRESGAYDRDEGALHGDRPRPGEQKEKAGVRRLDERGLRQESRPSVSRGRGSHAGPDGEGPLVVCVLESGIR
jgi:hypothetical protein